MNMVWTKEKQKIFNKKYWPKWYAKNKEKYKLKQKEYYKNKYLKDEKFREKQILRVNKYNLLRKPSTRRLKLRFQILARDNFTCQYCGRKAPEVILHVDHVFPKSKGGLNRAENYRTACLECNLGKGDSILID